MLLVNDGSMDILDPIGPVFGKKTVIESCFPGQQKFVIKETSMNGKTSEKTLRDEIAEVIAAEKQAAAVLAEQKRLEEQKQEDEARIPETIKAQEIIAGIREMVLASDRANWKPLMTLSESEVFIPTNYNNSDIMLVREAARQVRDYCRENGIEVRIVPERADEFYSISSTTGVYFMKIRVK